VSQRLSLRDREAEALAAELEHTQNPDLAAVYEKLTHHGMTPQIPGQVSLDDYPEVFSDAA
jgi:hypothetical protein